MNDDDDDSVETAVFTPKKSNLSRQAVEKNALRKSLAPSLSSERFSLRQNEERPSYSVDQLNELKTSTPSTPKDLRSLSDIDSDQGRELDLAAKFGSNLALQRDSAIPTNAEIREKKERRARLAKEQEYINLDSDGDEAEEDEDSNDERSLLPYAKPKPRKEETRLVRDDEDIAEGFDDFVEDGRIALGRKGEKEQKRRHNADIRDLINEAEGGGSDESSEDDSEAERKAAYEAAQTKAGMDGMRKEERGAKPQRPRTPPRITPLPTLGGCLERLKAQLVAKEFSRIQKVSRLEEVRKELADIEVRKVEVQRLLNEAGERYARLRAEAGVEGGKQLVDAGLGSDGMGQRSRGLESLGST